MRKILLIVAVVLCVAVAGTAFAVRYNTASDKSGTLAADSYLKLSLGETVDVATLNLSSSQAANYHIFYEIDRSSANAGTADLVITVRESVEGKNLDEVTIGVYDDELGQTATSGVTVTGAKGDATQTFTISGLTDGSDVYLRLSVPSDIANETLVLQGGSVSVSLQAHTAA